MFSKVDGKAAHWPRKKPLDFDGNADHVTLGLWFGSGQIGPSNTRDTGMFYTWRSFHSNNFTESAALAEVYALLSAVIVITGTEFTRTISLLTLTHSPMQNCNVHVIMIHTSHTMR